MSTSGSLCCCLFLTISIRGREPPLHQFYSCPKQFSLREPIRAFGKDLGNQNEVYLYKTCSFAGMKVFNLFTLYFEILISHTTGETTLELLWTYYLASRELISDKPETSRPGSGTMMLTRSHCNEVN